MCSLNLPQASSKLVSVNASQIIMSSIHPLCILFPTKTCKMQPGFFIFIYFFHPSFISFLSCSGFWLHGGQEPFIKRQGIVFSLGNVYVPSATPNWENRLLLRKPSVSASCELSGWFSCFIRHLNPLVISPFHLSACHQNYSEGSMPPSRRFRAWVSSVVLGLPYKNKQTKSHLDKKPLPSML